MHKRVFPFANRFYPAYRKIRFLAKRGTFFSLQPQDVIGEMVVTKGTFKLILFNSFFLFLLAYLFIYLLNLFITGYTAVIFNIPVVIYFNDVDYLIRGNDWTSDSVSGVFSSGPLFLLVLSVFFLILYTTVITETGILRLLLLFLRD